MMFTAIKLFFVIIILEGCRSQICDNSLLKMYENNACYIVSDCMKAECIMDVNVTYNVDFESGLLISNFTLPPLECCHHHYDIYLLVDEHIKNESQCLENRFVRETHSIKRYAMKKCENGNSIDKSLKQHGAIVFNNIYTGCYKLQFKPFKRTGSGASLYSNTTYIQTNFTKKFMPKVSYYYHYSSLWKELQVKFMMGTYISGMKIELSFCNNNTIVNGGPIIVKKEIKNDCMPTSVWDSKKCAYIFEGVNCTFYNISPGNYCIFVAVMDDRCAKDTLWTKYQKCTWRKTIECNAMPENLAISVSPPAIKIFSAVGIFGTTILLIILVFICKRRRVNRNFKQGENLHEVKPLTESKIELLLLYPRDCKEFMNVMNSYGKFLNKLKNVEVFDCYSDEVIENGPLQYLLNLMSRPKLCTIIVNSKCAFIQQNAMKLGIVTASGSYYKDPNFMDPIFKYGLKLIMEDTAPDIYQKNYVIGFDGFSENNHVLTLPTSFRRYTMPNHLKKLLTDMKIENCDENFYLNSSEYITLWESIKSLAKYKSKNPNYLENMLKLI